MKRKVFRNGPSLVVTLPSKWIEQYGVCAGNEIEVEQSGDQLILGSEHGKQKDFAEISTEGIDRTFLRCSIRSAYKNGYNKIKIIPHKETLKHHRTNTDVKVHTIVNEEANALIGFEIIESNPVSITVKGFSVEDRDDFDKFLRKIFLKLTEHAKDLAKAPEDEKIFDSWEIKPWTLKKFMNYCIRILNKKGHEHPAQLYHVISSLDIILSIIHHTGRYVKDHKLSYGKKTKEIIGNIIEIYSLFYDFFYNYSNEKIVEISLKRKAIRESIEQSAEDIPAKEMIFIERFYQTVEIFYRLLEARMDIHIK